MAPTTRQLIDIAIKSFVKENANRLPPSVPVWVPPAARKVLVLACKQPVQWRPDFGTPRCFYSAITGGEGLEMLVSL